MCDGFSEVIAGIAAGASEAGAAAGTAAEAGAAASTAAEAGAVASTAAEAGTAGAAAAEGAAAAGGVLGTGLSAGQIAFGVGSAALSAYSNYAQANAAQKAAAYTAQVEANNARIGQQQRSAAIDAGQSAAMQSSMQAAQMLGNQKAGLAANGVSLGSGSAVDLLASTRFLNSQDVNTIQSNAARQAWGYSVDSANSQAQSGLSAWQSKNNNPLAVGAAGGATSLLSTASMYAMGNKTNLFNSMTG